MHIYAIFKTTVCALFLSSICVSALNDSDGDKMPDAWEMTHGLDHLSNIGDSGANGDPDADLLINYYEYLSSTLPLNPDSNTNSISDADEDSDGDTLSNFFEQEIYNTDPGRWDSDGDGLSDWSELFLHSTNPTNSDTDGDRMSDGWEVRNSTSPIASNAAGMHVDIMWAGTTKPPGNSYTYDVSIVPPYAYTADGPVCFSVTDISSPTNPVHLSQYDDDTNLLIIIWT